MTEIIKVENLSKVYHLGETLKHNSFRDKFDDWLKDPFGRKKTERDKKEDILWVLKNVSFSVRQGQVVGIIGRNGAGKSTLLKILSRITEPTSGKIILKGRVASLLEVGTGFHPELTGRENIFLNGAILGMSKFEIKSKFNEIVSFAEIERFLDTPVKRYSSGMYVRLAFAVAAHLDPEILLVDEVLAVGDFEFQKKCLGKMRDIARGGRTVLFVSHNMSAINQLCTRCLLIEKGEVIFDDVSEKTIKTYLSDGISKSQVIFPVVERLPAQILSANILSDNGEILGLVNYDQEFVVCITGIINKKCQTYHTLMAIKDSLNNDIIFSTDSDLNDSAIGKQTGGFEYSVKLPSKLLKPGIYNIRLMLIKRERGQLFGGEVLSDNSSFLLKLEIVDLKSKRAKEHRYGNAAIAPELQWCYSAIK